MYQKGYLQDIYLISLFDYNFENYKISYIHARVRARARVCVCVHIQIFLPINNNYIKLYKR